MSGSEKESTSAIPISVTKLAAFLPISKELLERAQVDTRTPEQKQADRDRFIADEAAKRQKIMGRHSTALGSADQLARSVLELHGPVFSGPYSWATCEGCDFAGYESEPPDFPCRTYELVVNAVTV